MNLPPVLLVQLSSRGNELLRRCRSALSGVSSPDLRSLAEKVPTSLTRESPLRLVFVGAYSAGKSSLLRAITGRGDIKTGAGIVTDATSTYQWEGIELVDTPGIHTSLRPNHDTITYDAIASADLLVFVITNELMDAALVAHFQKLAAEQGKGHEMMLVVNKMTRHALGNVAASHAIVRDALRGMLAPFSPEELRVTFTDAELALDSRRAATPADAQLDLEESGVPRFIEAMNTFVREQGLVGRLTTSLYELEQLLQEALARTDSGDPLRDGVEELLVQKRRSLIEARARVLQVQRSHSGTARAAVHEQGEAVANGIDADATEESVNERLHRAQQRVDEVAAGVQQALLADLSGIANDVRHDVDGIFNGELAKTLLPKLTGLLENAASRVSIDPSSLRSGRAVGEASREFGQFLLKNSFNSKASTFGGLWKLGQYSGTEMHGVVKSVGSFFGKSFKPWEAVRMTKTVANVGRVLSVAGTVLSVAIQFKEDADAAAQRKQLKDARIGVRKSFDDAALSLSSHLEKGVGEFVADNLTPEISRVDQQLQELRSISASNQEVHSRLLALLEETRILLSDAHALLPSF